MGNSNSQTRNEQVLDSRVIKISESVAKKLLVQPQGQGGNQGGDMKSKPTKFYLPEAPMPRQHQPYRDDGNYVDDILFQEFQKQEVMNELQNRALNKKLLAAFEPFTKPPPAPKQFVTSEEQKRLTECFRKHHSAPLKCHAEVLDFATYARESVYPKMSSQR